MPSPPLHSLLTGAEAKDESGRFVVEDYLCLGSALRPDLDSPFLSSAPSSGNSSSSSSNAPHLLLVSGLNFGSKNPDNIFPSQFLADFVTGGSNSFVWRSRDYELYCTPIHLVIPRIATITNIESCTLV